jgi:hypothetical protein
VLLGLKFGEVERERIMLILIWLSSFHWEAGQCVIGELSVYIQAECLIKSELFRSYKIRNSFCVVGA